MGGKLTSQYANNLGFGEKTGIPSTEESLGLIPTDEYMRQVHKVRITGGQFAMLAIGQGSTEIPLQMAQAMSVPGNGGVLYQARLVKQVQDFTGDVVSAYNVRERKRMEIPPATQAALRQGTVGVVTKGKGTAH